MIKAYKYRLYPTKAQATLLDKHMGCCRFIYNLALETKQMAWAGNRVNLTCFDLINQMVSLKNDLPWLREVNSQSLQSAVINLDKAYTSFFKGQNDFPKFKTKSGRQSFVIPDRLKVDFSAGKVSFPKLREGIKTVFSREFKGIIKQAAISKSSTDKYFISINVDNGTSTPNKFKITNKKTIGIDLGIKSFLVTSNGDKTDNPNFLIKGESKLKYAQSRYSKYKGKRSKKRRAILYEKITNQRKNFLQQVSSKLISENQTIAIENLNIKGMMQNKNLAKSIGEASWYEFIQYLKYKADWTGNNIIKIGMFDPSSKTCSNCGTINKELTLEVREWTCKGCNSVLDRDVNAAINIKNFALKNYLSVGSRLKNRNELPTLVGVLTSENH